MEEDKKRALHQAVSRIANKEDIKRKVTSNTEVSGRWTLHSTSSASFQYLFPSFPFSLSQFSWVLELYRVPSTALSFLPAPRSPLHHHPLPSLLTEKKETSNTGFYSTVNVYEKNIVVLSDQSWQNTHGTVTTANKQSKTATIPFIREKKSENYKTS